MTISVRLARNDDSSFIETLGMQTAHATLSQVRAISRDVAEQAYQRLAVFCRQRAGTVTLIAEAEGARAGFLILLTDMPDDITHAPAGFIAYLAVIADQRGSGVGRALVQAAVAEGQRRKLTHISLMVSADNGAARSLYESEHFMHERILMTRPLGTRAAS